MSSKLEQLLQKLCPNGVKFVALGDFANVSRGGSFQKKDFTPLGFPCIHYGQIHTKFGIFITEAISFLPDELAARQRKAEHGDIIMAVTSEDIDDVCKASAWLGGTSVAVSGHTAIIHHQQNPKYLSYYFNSSAFAAQKRKLAHGTKVIEVTPKDLLNVKIPLPPIEIQNEIVGILDKLTKLTAELTAELTARQKQYEYYRDQLLNFENRGGYNVLTIKELCNSLKKGTLKQGELDEAGQYPVINSGRTFYGRYKNYNNEANAITLAARGEYAGFVNYINEAFWAGGLCYPYRSADEQKCLTKFLYHVLKHQEQHIMNTLVSRGSIPAINKADVDSIKICVPPLSEQQRIVSTLDRFEALCSDLTAGLPAEIEARKKQYEYYQDKLLTFTPLAES